MRDFLKDLVTHTHSLGFLSLVRITASDTETLIDSVADDQTIIISGKTHVPVPGLAGVLGLPNMRTLDYYLKCPEYATGVEITLVTGTRGGNTIPTGLHFKNSAGDFENDYRFMNAELINEKLKCVTFNGAKWAVEVEPSLSAIQRMKFQAAANPEEKLFQVTTKDSNLIFSFGDANTHGGSFIFASSITGKLNKTWTWPIKQVLSVLDLPGTLKMNISNIGVIQISIDTGISEYLYNFPAATK